LKQQKDNLVRGCLEKEVLVLDSTALGGTSECAGAARRGLDGGSAFRAQSCTKRRESMDYPNGGDGWYDSGMEEN
jgi:hypothetical protein